MLIAGTTRRMPASSVLILPLPGWDGLSLRGCSAFGLGLLETHDSPVRHDPVRIRGVVVVHCATRIDVALVVSIRVGRPQPPVARLQRPPKNLTLLLAQIIVVIRSHPRLQPVICVHYHLCPVCDPVAIDALVHVVGDVYKGIQRTKMGMRFGLLTASVIVPLVNVDTIHKRGICPPDTGQCINGSFAIFWVKIQR